MKGGNLKVSYCLIRQKTVSSIHWFTISSQMSVPIVGLLVNWQVMHSSAICSWEVTKKTLLHHSISQLSCFVKARRCLQSILSWFGHSRERGKRLLPRTRFCSNIWVVSVFGDNTLSQVKNYVTRAPLLYFVRSWVALFFKVCEWVRHR